MDLDLIWGRYVSKDKDKDRKLGVMHCDDGRTCVVSVSVRWAMGDGMDDLR